MSLLSILSKRKRNFQLSALHKALAIVEFEINGNIITANDNFLSLMGYTLEEVQGRPHSIFVDPEFANSEDYSKFWVALRKGEYVTSDFKRLGKGGREIWFHASYIPVPDSNGRPCRILMLASDITTAKRAEADIRGQVDAVDKSHAVIAFDVDGIILNANPKFLAVMGYNLEEIKGKHHRIFVDPAEAESTMYKRFWQNLARGEYQAAEYKRIGKGGKEVWIQASYNPILDQNGRPFKVVKYATDVTAQKLQYADFRGQIDAIGKSQAVISFNLDGTIIDANANFLAVMGYRLEEIKGKHHRIFIDPSEAESPAYKQFWQSLARGEYQAAEYKRLGKGGKDVWIQASYNPIFDPNGRPFKVVKYATDVTAEVLVRQQQQEASARVDRNLEQIVDSVSMANSQASTAASASTQTASSMEMIAAAAEEFETTARDIASNMAASREAVEKAILEIQSVDQSTKALSTAADSMTNIVELIQNIAGQINLLALNATIESARAGDAGKGFAVVASEVKNLANQVATATGQITSEISGIQSASDEVVTRIIEIKSSIEPVQTGITMVASAAEQQNASTREISANMQAASAAVNEISSSLEHIASAVRTANDFAAEGMELYRNTTKIKAAV